MRTIIFDFDGVIVDSVPLKTAAFVTLYQAASREQQTYVRDYQLRHGGVSRVHKIAHFEQRFSGAAMADADIAERVERYARLVEDAVCACPFIAGAEMFLRSNATRFALHLVSGTPTDELRRIVERRGLAGWFRSVTGSPPDKLTTFSAILAAGRVEPAEALAVGDSITEYDAAAALGISFLGIVAAGAPNPFPASVPTLPDLVNMRQFVDGLPQTS